MPIFGDTTTTATIPMLNSAAKRGRRKNKDVTLPPDDKNPLTAKKGFTFGCDPELFIKNEKGVIVSAEGLIPGSKEDPFKVDKGAIQVDGMAAEFNIDPASTFDEFNTNIVTVMKELKNRLPEGYGFAVVPSVEFDKEIFDAAPDKAKELGCSPDYNAWTGELNDPPSTENIPTTRCAGGHLHIGWTNDVDIGDLQHLAHCRDLVKQLDWYLGGWSLKHDSDAVRRRLYGKAGACRIKPYGVEYRVLSNFWIGSKARRLAVWNRMVLAIEDMRRNFVVDRLPRQYSVNLVESINESKLSPSLADVYYPIHTIHNDYRTY